VVQRRKAGMVISVPVMMDSSTAEDLLFMGKGGLAAQNDPVIVGAVFGEGPGPDAVLTQQPGQPHGAPRGS
jgi:hypothetical protein